MYLRRSLTAVSIAVIAIVAFVNVVRSDAAKITGLTPGTVYLAPGHGELLMEVFNPTSKAIVVQYEVKNPYGNWNLLIDSESVEPGEHNGISFYCDDLSYCGGVPVISPATLVPSLRWQPLSGGYDFIPAGGFRTMK